MKSNKWIRRQLHKNGILRPKKKSWQEKIAYYVLGVRSSLILRGMLKMTFADSEYTIFSLEENKAMIEKCKTDLIGWQPQVSDCDNFAKLLTASMGVNFKNNGIGTCFGWVTDKEGKRMKHAWNCFITSDKKVYFLEPQTDEIMEVNNGKAQGRRWKYFNVSRVFFF